jgi:serine/threonine protein kinase
VPDTEATAVIQQNASIPTEVASQYKNNKKSETLFNFLKKNDSKDSAANSTTPITVSPVEQQVHQPSVIVADKSKSDLLKKMLEFHPNNRISIIKALEHPFLASLHNADDEPSAGFTFSFAFENEDLSRERVQELMWEELKSYHPHIPESPPSSTPRRRARPMLPDNKAESKIEHDDDNRDNGRASKKRSSSPPNK